MPKGVGKNQIAERRPVTWCEASGGGVNGLEESGDGMGVGGKILSSALDSQRVHGPGLFAEGWRCTRVC